MSLQKMLDDQNELQKVMPPLFGIIRYDGVDGTQPCVEFIKEMKLALDDEIHEMIAEMSWKLWASKKFLNRDAAVSEMVDAWHFFMNILLALGVTEEELTRLYYEKRAKNAARQKVGYDGVSTKCPVCKRAYDDTYVKCKPAGKITPETMGLVSGQPNLAYCAVSASYVKDSRV